MCSHQKALVDPPLIYRDCIILLNEKKMTEYDHTNGMITFI